ncbi:ABC transporter ATP-binding protein [Paenibacillus sp. 598K]|nr:ABC transporter ATP-binding protein [Paenibacillus sp. 598K]
MIRILTGLAKPSSGQARVLGHDVSKETVHIRRKIGYCPQAPAFYSYLTGQQWMEWAGSIFKLDKTEAKRRTEQLLELCGIADARHRTIGGYSGGMKQRLAIAQALIHNPQLLILDEPVSALDPIGRYEVLQLIEQIKSEMTVFMSTHILDDVERVADHIVIIDDGSIILSASLAELQAEYIDPVVHFTVRADGLDVPALLSEQPWIATVHREGQSYKVTAPDSEALKRLLPRLLLDAGCILTSYTIGQSSLEEVYLKVVKR